MALVPLSPTASPQNDDRCLRFQTEPETEQILESTRRWHQVYGEYLTNLPRGPTARPTARIITQDQARAARVASARRDLRRREGQVIQRRLARAITYGENHSLKELVEEVEAVVAEYLVGLPEPNPIMTFLLHRISAVSSWSRIR